MRHLFTKVAYVTDPATGRSWPIPAGGSDDDHDGDDHDGDDPGDPDDLGDAGKRALDAERKARRAAEKRAKELEDRIDSLETAQLDDHEREVKEAAKQAAAETRQELMARIAAAKAETLAATSTRDPEVAVALLGDLSGFVTADGDIDVDAMSTALDELLEGKPYLKPETATAPGGADQGRRPPADAPSLGDLEDPDEVLAAVRGLR